MFMQIAIGAIGIGVVLMVGYLVIAQIRTSLPETRPDPANTSNTLYNISADLNSTQTTIFAGFGLVAVGIIVLAAFGLINIFK